MSDKEKAAREAAEKSAYDYGLCCSCNQNITGGADLWLAGAEWATPKWIKCSERLPEIGKVVLAKLDTRYFPVIVFRDRDDDDYWWEDLHGVAYDGITHWMPLPEASKEEE